MRSPQNNNDLLIILTLSLICSATIISAQGKDGNAPRLHLDELFQELAEVSHLKEVILFAQAKIVEGNPDMTRIVNYMNGSDFKAINDFMWESPQFFKVSSDGMDCSFFRRCCVSPSCFSKTGHFKFKGKKCYISLRFVLALRVVSCQPFVLGSVLRLALQLARLGGVPLHQGGADAD